MTHTRHMKKKPGRKADDGATELRRVGVGLDPKTIREAKRLGNGNLSLGLREAVRLATMEWAA